MVSRIRADGYEMLRSPTPVATGLQDLAATLSGMEIRSMHVQHNSNAVGRSLAELDLRREYGITVLTISGTGRKVTLPDGDERFQEHDESCCWACPSCCRLPTIFSTPTDTSARR